MVGFIEISDRNLDGKLIPPKEISRFHLDENSQILLDQFHFRYLYEPLLERILNPPLNLMDGLGTYKFRNPNAEQLGDQFRWILTKANTMPNASLKNIVDDADFFTYRGLLSTLSTTIYNAKYGWTILACKFRDVIFLCEEANQWKLTEEHKRSTYPGHKFEQYITTDNPKVKPNTSIPVDNFEKSFKVYLGVFTRNAKPPISCAYTAEVDAVDENRNDLKIITEFESINRRNPKFKLKYAKYAMQSHLVGISDVVVGYKSDPIHIRLVKREKVNSLLSQGQRTTACLALVYDFLDNIKEIIDSKPESWILKCDFNAKEKGRLQLDWVEPNSMYAFISNEIKTRFPA